MPVVHIPTKPAVIMPVISHRLQLQLRQELQPQLPQEFQHRHQQVFLTILFQDMFILIQTETV
ncbi:MAG: hypothetical protein A2W22_01360 [Candidatus Levybacteria bacterium RBG_16_35_11]|nr:MAG: hypothetical protein A2W22_01360 [Candidatus Levybacteria bacterium RBG_16_35_11]